ncbi:MAG: S8 family serine peptidase, partial [Bacteroidota bacterium]
MGFTTSKNGIVVAGADTNLNGNGILQNAQVSSYSSFGPTDDGRIKPDIAGDGGLIRSTSDNGNTSYSNLRGTSMAAPGITGSLLLLQSYHEELFGNYMKAASLKGLALHTADDIGALGPDYKMGWGVINTKRAAEVLSNHEYRSLITETTLRSGETYSITVSANEIEPLVASISWTDPASENINEGLLNDAVPVLVNDLDIRITKNGTSYQPWLLDPNNSDAPATTGDNQVDPFERVDVLQPKGQYTITVTHKGDLVNEAQTFSLILTGISETDCVLVPPSDIFMDQPTEKSISWFWEAQPETLYEIQTQEVGTETWDSQLSWENTIAMDSLEIGTSYKLRLRTLCAATLTSEFSETLEFEFQGTETKLKSTAMEEDMKNGSLAIYPNPAEALIQVNDEIMDHGASYVIASL